MKSIRWVFFLLLLASPLLAQTSYSVLIPANPPGGVGAACSATTFGYLAPLTGGSRLVLCNPSTHLWTVAAGGGSGCIPAGSANGVLVDDGAGGCITTGVTIYASAGAGAIAFPQGTARTAPANNVGFQAPTSVTSAFYFTLPGAPAAGLIHATNATPSVMSVSAVSLTADVSGILPVANGGTNNAFFTVSGPAASAKTYTFPNANATISYTIASGAKALATGAISGNTCTTAQTDTATGTLTTDAIAWVPNTDITATTGYNVAGTFGLEIFAYPTADTVNFKVCNTTASSITPGAVTINWRVSR